jgi:hypothetical protein
MRCDDARLGLSLRADGEPNAPATDVLLDAHVADCPGCRHFAGTVRDVRAQLRLEAVDRVPDVGPAVLARLVAEAPAGSPRPARPHPSSPGAPAPPSRPRVAVAAAVAAVAGLVGGATFVGLDSDPPTPAAADVPERVLAGQADVMAVEARYTVTEPGDGGRTFDAHLTYRAPEALALRVRETTAGAPPAERAEADLVVDGDRWWHAATRQCSPAAGLVRCPREPVRWSRAVTGREPFSDAAPVPLELVVPVDAFALAATPAGLGQRTVAGHPAVGVAVTAAQVSGYLEGLSAAVPLRAVHPGDRVELWLDDDRLVPLALVVRAGDDPVRAAWAAAAGRAEAPGDVVLRVEATDVRINEPGTTVPDMPTTEATTTVDAGFRPVSPGEDPVVPVPGPAAPPAGFTAHRAGIVTTPGGPPVGVRSWSDGRAWFTVRATTAWPGGRLFGDLGLDVRPVDLGAAGLGYVSSDGRRIALHAAGLDVVVAGSLPLDDLLAVAADLGVVGEAVPDDWAEARTARPEEAEAALPGRLTAGALDGFGDPALRVIADDAGGVTVTEARSGPGDRAFVLTQRLGTALPPPQGGDEVGVGVRGTVGRARPAEGELAWVEGGVVCTLRGAGLSLGELAAIAERLERA